MVEILHVLQHRACFAEMIVIPSPLIRAGTWPGLSRCALSQCRRFATANSVAEGNQPDDTPNLSSRWLSDVKARVGRCITFGMSSQQVDEAAMVLQEVSTDWRALVAGSEGYLTSKERAGLYKQAVVWGEQDSMGHVNNVMYVRYAESARCNWTRNFGKYFDPTHKKEWTELLSSKNIGLILKSITVDFKFPMTWPDRISVYHKLRSNPDKSSSSLVLDVTILSESRQRVAARCLEDVVVYDYKQGKKTTLAPFMLEQFRKTFELQEKARKENSAKVNSILDRVRVLEQQTWDRADAKEDFGSASC